LGQTEKLQYQIPFHIINYKEEKGQKKGTVLFCVHPNTKKNTPKKEKGSILL
jgi:hypothetical protein